MSPLLSSSIFLYHRRQIPSHRLAPVISLADEVHSIINSVQAKIKIVPKRKQKRKKTNKLNRTTPPVTTTAGTTSPSSTTSAIIDSPLVAENDGDDNNPILTHIRSNPSGRDWTKKKDAILLQYEQNGCVKGSSNIKGKHNLIYPSPHV